MAHAAQRERIEMRVDRDTKQLAERASAALGFSSLTDYMVRLIREHAPQTLENQGTIRLANAQFDRFMAICDDVDREPSAQILAAAKRLDTEGY